jgi:hypothetical protein
LPQQKLAYICTIEILLARKGVPSLAKFPEVVMNISNGFNQYSIRVSIHCLRMKCMHMNISKSNFSPGKLASFFTIAVHAGSAKLLSKLANIIKHGGIPVGQNVPFSSKTFVGNPLRRNEHFYESSFVS